MGLHEGKIVPDKPGASYKGVPVMVGREEALTLLPGLVENICHCHICHICTTASSLSWAEMGLQEGLGIFCWVTFPYNGYTKPCTGTKEMTVKSKKNEISPEFVLTAEFML